MARHVSEGRIAAETELEAREVEMVRGLTHLGTDSKRRLPARHGIAEEEHRR